jgi:hypothetical protein
MLVILILMRKMMPTNNTGSELSYLGEFKGKKSFNLERCIWGGKLNYRAQSPFLPSNRGPIQ